MTNSKKPFALFICIIIMTGLVSSSLLSVVNAEPGPLSYFTLSDNAVGDTCKAGDIVIFSAHGYDANGISMGDYTEGVTWTITPAAGGTWAADSSAYLSEKAGTWQVTATYPNEQNPDSPITGAISLIVTASDLYSLTVTNSTGSSIIVTGDTIGFYAEGFDQYGNFINYYTNDATWGIDAGAYGTWDWSSYTSETVGTWTVTATYGSVVGQTSLTVGAPRVLTSMYITDFSGGTVTSGESVTFMLTGLDQYGGAVMDVDFSSATWHIDGDAGGSWGTATSTGNSYGTNTPGTWNVTATFGSLTANTTITVQAEGGGDPGGDGGPTMYTLTIMGATDYSPGGSYEEGTSFYVTALPDEGYYLSYWLLDGSSNAGEADSSIHIVMDTDHTLEPVFAELPQYTLTIESTVGGSTDPAGGDHLYYEESTASVTAYPDEGYTFTRWLLDNEPTGITDSTYELQMFGNHLLTAVFNLTQTQATYTITVTQADYGTISDVTKGYAEGSNVDEIVTPENGYYIKSITVDGEPVPVTTPRGQTVSFTNLSANHTITASFDTVYFLLSPAAPQVAPGGSVAFTVTGKDIADNPLGDFSDIFTWSIEEVGHGGSWSGSTYTSAVQGEWTVRAKLSDSLSFYAILTVGEAEPSTYTLTIVTSGEGTVSPGNQTYNLGDSVDIKAFSAENWGFYGWSGDASGKLNQTITINSNMVITATFVNVYNCTLTVYVDNQVSEISPLQFAPGAILDMQSMDWGNVFDHYRVDGVNTTEHSIQLVFDQNHTLDVFTRTPQLTIQSAVGGATNTTVGIHSYAYNEQVSVTATPSGGYAFSHWLVDGEENSTSSQITLTMSADYTLTPVFVKTYTLTMITVGEGTVSPGNQTYIAGTVVDLKAFTSSKYGLFNWSHSFETGNTTLTMNSDIAITARFVEYFNLTVNIYIDGQLDRSLFDKYFLNSVVELVNMEWGNIFDHSSIDGVDGNTEHTFIIPMDTDHVVDIYTRTQPKLTIQSTVGGATNTTAGEHLYDNSTIVTVTETPSEGYVFLHWLVDGEINSTNSQITLTMDVDHTLRAVFLKDVTLTMITVGEGTVSPGNRTYHSGESVDLIAYCADGWMLQGWSGDTDGHENGTFTMDSDMTITATFVPAHNLLFRLYVDGVQPFDGSVSPFEAGSNMTIDIADMLSSMAYTYMYAFIDGVYTNNASCFFQMDQDHIFIVYAAVDPPCLTIESAVGGTTNPADGTQLYFTGDIANVTATPAQGYSFSHWLLDGETNSTSSQITLTMSADHTLQPVFEASVQTYTLTMKTVGGGTVSPGNNTYTAGSSVDLKAFYSTGWAFSGWSGDTSGTANKTITINGDMTITATFTRTTYNLTYRAYQDGQLYADTVNPQNIGVTISGYLEFAPGIIIDHLTIDGVNSTQKFFYSVVMDQDHTIEVYTRTTTQLNILSTTGGSTNTTVGIHSYDGGQQVTVTATPAEGYTFSHWLLDIYEDNIQNPITITMNADHNLTAVFTNDLSLHTVTFTMTGLLDGASWSVTFDGVMQTSTTNTITFTNVASGGYAYWVTVPHGYKVDPLSGVVIVSGGDASKTVAYSQDSGLYSVTFTEEGLNEGESWSVTLDGITLSSTTDTITFEEIGSGNYAYTVTYPTNYMLRVPYILEFTVNGENTSPCITFAPKVVLTANVYINNVLQLIQLYNYSQGAEIELSSSYLNLPAYLVLDHWAIPDFGSGTNSSLDLVMDQNYTINAYLTYITLKLTVSTSAGGSVDPSVGDHTYVYNTWVTVTATPDEGYVFKDWVIDGEIAEDTSNPIEIRMRGNHTIVAEFEEGTEDVYIITINIEGTGCSVTLNPDQETYHYGDTVELTPTPASGYQFSSWSGDLEGTDEYPTVTITQNITITATFSHTKYTVSLKIFRNGEVLGGEDELFNAGSTHNYNFTELPPEYRWVGVVVDNGTLSTLTSYDLLMNQSHSLYVYFTTAFRVDVWSGTGGSTDLEPGTYNYWYGDIANITATADSGYTFAYWQLSNDTQVMGETLHLRINNNYDVTPVFTEHQDNPPPPPTYYTLTVLTVGDGTVSTGNGSYTYDQAVHLTATAAEGWIFSGWSGNYGADNPASVTITSDIVITATFTRTIHTLTIEAALGGTTNPQGTHSCSYGETAQITANASKGYSFSYWQLSNGTQATDNPLSVTMTCNLTVTPIFTQNPPVTYVLTINSATGGSTLPQIGTYTYNESSTATITANAQDHYKFINWLLDNHAYSTNSTIALQMNANHTLTPVFEHTECQITVVNPHGTSQTVNVTYGGEYAVSAYSEVMNGTARKWVCLGYRLDGAPTVASFSYTFNNVTSDHTITFLWQQQYLVTFQSNPSEGGYTTASEWHSSGTLPIQACANPGYTFALWTAIGSASLASAASMETSVTIAGPATLTANFETVNTIVAIKTTDNQTYIFGLEGNVTRQQMSNMTITPHPENETTSVEFTVTGPSGESGYGTITLPVESIPYGTRPVIYIDGVLAHDQTCRSDGNYYYITYSTHFSTHDVSIVFLTDPSVTPTPTPTPDPDTPTTTPTPTPDTTPTPTLSPTPDATPTPTTSPSSTPTPSNTPTTSPEYTATPTATPDPTANSAPTSTTTAPTQTNTQSPTRNTTQPTQSGFAAFTALVAAIIALLLIALGVAYRRRSKDDEKA